MGVRKNVKTLRYPAISRRACAVVVFLVAISVLPITPTPDHTILLADEISFKNDVMPLFMRGGCNSGSCHGSSRGKDGFKLSLFGYDPEGDYFRLVEEQIGRRVNLAAPDKSLLLDKAAGRVPHTGGTVFKPETKYFQTLQAWIAAGAPRDSDDAAQPVRIELSPQKITFDRPAMT